MGRDLASRTLIAGTVLAVLTSIGLAPGAAHASPQLASVVSQRPVSWTPNVSASAKVGQEGSGAACNPTFFSSSLSCQSEVYSTAYVNGEVVVAGAFTRTCKPGTLAQGLCSPATQVVRNDIFAYQAGTGRIDPNFKPVLNAGPAWSVVAGPPGSNTVYVGGAFSKVNGSAHRGVVQLHVNPGVTTGPNADGKIATGFRGQAAGTVRGVALSPDGGSLYIGGQFSSVDGAQNFKNGRAVRGVARLNAKTGALDTSFAFTLGDPPAGLSARAETIALSPNGGLLAVASTALQVDGKPRPRLALISTGGKLGGAAKVTDFTAPILSDNCLKQHDYVRGLAFAPTGSFLAIADTGNSGDGSHAFSACDAVARFDVTAANTTTTGASVNVSPAWLNYSGRDSFYAVAIAGNVVYAGGHNRWANNACGVDHVCEPNAVLVNGLSALDAHTGLALPWWHPQTTRGAGVMYLNTFGAGTYLGKGGQPGLALGTDVDVIDGAFHAENALFPLAATTSATPGGPIPSGIFHEAGGLSRSAPMCLAPSGQSPAAGSPAELAPCDNSAGQIWSVRSGGILQDSGLCLDTAGHATAAGTPAVLGTCKAGTATQQWAQGSGNSLVNNGASGGQPMCLDDPGGSTTAGAQLTIAACTGGPDQAWPLPVAQGPPTSAPVGPVYPQEIQVNDQVPCLDDTGNATTAGNTVALRTCRGNAQQQWTIQADGRIQLGASHCLDTSGGAGAPGTPVVLDPCSGAASQSWTPGPHSSLVQQSSGLCLADPSSAGTNGVQPQLAACTGKDNQAWRLPAN
jgi:hypothetical protein